MILWVKEFKYIKMLNSKECYLLLSKSTLNIFDKKSVIYQLQTRFEAGNGPTLTFRAFANMTPRRYGNVNII